MDGSVALPRRATSVDFCYNEPHRFGPLGTYYSREEARLCLCKYKSIPAVSPAPSPLN